MNEPQPTQTIESLVAVKTKTAESMNRERPPPIIRFRGSPFHKPQTMVCCEGTVPVLCSYTIGSPHSKNPMASNALAIFTTPSELAVPCGSRCGPQS